MVSMTSTKRPMLETTPDLRPLPEAVDDGMSWVEGGTFRMGSDRHYPEEAPVHRVTVDGFWIDRTPVTNRQFQEFVKATGHVTFAEIAPDPEGLSRRAAAHALCRLARVHAAGASGRPAQLGRMVDAS